MQRLPRIVVASPEIAVERPCSCRTSRRADRRLPTRLNPRRSLASSASRGSHYDTLGVSKVATRAQIKERFYEVRGHSLSAPLTVSYRDMRIPTLARPRPRRVGSRRSRRRTRSWATPRHGGSTTRRSARRLVRHERRPRARRTTAHLDRNTRRPDRSAAGASRTGRVDDHDPRTATPGAGRTRSRVPGRRRRARRSIGQIRTRRPIAAAMVWRRGRSIGGSRRRTHGGRIGSRADTLRTIRSPTARFPTAAARRIGSRRRTTSSRAPPSSAGS